MRVVGVLGSGQLGRMLALAAGNMGMRCAVYGGGEEDPAMQVAWRYEVGAWDAWDKLERWAKGIDVATWEFEQVAPATAAFVAGLGVEVWPSTQALELFADRVAEKRFAEGLGLAVAPYAEIAGDVAGALAQTGLPAVLKVVHGGYDGKGQIWVADEEQGRAAWRELGGEQGVRVVAEGKVPFVREISVVAARGKDGAFAAYDVGENRHEEGILRETRVVGGVAQEAEAVACTRKMCEALGYVGVLAVEFFVCADGKLVMNEVAPRVHNTGHWTMDASATSQFEQHIRAICGWPLGSVERWADVRMVNVLGEDGMQEWLARGAKVHMYGKREAREGRKMGHVTMLYPLGAGVG